MWYKNAASVLIEVDFSADSVELKSTGLFINGQKVSGADRRIYWLNNEEVQGVNQDMGHDGLAQDAFRVQAMANGVVSDSRTTQ